MIFVLQNIVITIIFHFCTVPWLKGMSTIRKNTHIQKRWPRGGTARRNERLLFDCDTEHKMYENCC
jgi:hypothetical protein